VASADPRPDRRARRCIAAESKFGLHAGIIDDGGARARRSNLTIVPPTLTHRESCRLFRSLQTAQGLDARPTRLDTCHMQCTHSTKCTSITNRPPRLDGASDEWRSRAPKQRFDLQPLLSQLGDGAACSDGRAWGCVLLGCGVLGRSTVVRGGSCGAAERSSLAARLGLRRAGAFSGGEGWKRGPGARAFHTKHHKGGGMALSQQRRFALCGWATLWRHVHIAHEDTGDATQCTRQQERALSPPLLSAGRPCCTHARAPEQ
jgi:hypothetical protein